jgi:hypothetical protein
VRVVRAGKVKIQQQGIKPIVETIGEFKLGQKSKDDMGWLNGSYSKDESLNPQQVNPGNPQSPTTKSAKTANQLS